MLPCPPGLSCAALASLSDWLSMSMTSPVPWSARSKTPLAFVGISSSASSSSFFTSVLDVRSFDRTPVPPAGAGEAPPTRPTRPDAQGSQRAEALPLSSNQTHHYASEKG
eukprot:6767834-Alexandrium_andersonii.AAC.1